MVVFSRFYLTVFRSSLNFPCPIGAHRLFYQLLMCMSKNNTKCTLLFLHIDIIFVDKRIGRFKLWKDSILLIIE